MSLTVDGPLTDSSWIPILGAVASDLIFGVRPLASENGSELREPRPRSHYKLPYDCPRRGITDAGT